MLCLFLLYRATEISISTTRLILRRNEESMQSGGTSTKLTTTHMGEQLVTGLLKPVIDVMAHLQFTHYVILLFQVDHAFHSARARTHTHIVTHTQLHTHSSSFSHPLCAEVFVLTHTQMRCVASTSLSVSMTPHFSMT